MTQKNTKIAETDRQVEIAVDIGYLSIVANPSESTIVDVHDRVWKAFWLGIEYQKEEW